MYLDLSKVKKNIFIQNIKDLHKNERLDNNLC